MTSTDPYARAVPSARFLHGLNPLSKIAAPLPAMTVLFLARGLITPATFIALGLALLLIGASLQPRALVGLLVGLPLAGGVMSLSFGLWTDPSAVSQQVVLMRIGGYSFSLAALAVGAATALRLVALIVLSLLAGITTTGADLTRSLTQQLKLPYRISYTALAAFRFVPLLGQDLRLIRAAHRVRGVDNRRGPIAAGRRWMGWIVPLLAGGIRHAERVAWSMDSRGFGAHPTRTERHLVPFRARDWTFMVGFWVATAVIVGMTWV